MLLSFRLELDPLCQLLIGFFDRLPSNHELFAPAFRQILPAAIFAFDQHNLSRALPPFQLLLTTNGSMNPIIALIVNQPVTVIALRETLNFTGFMLPDSHAQVIRHSN